MERRNFSSLIIGLHLFEDHGHVIARSRGIFDPLNFGTCGTQRQLVSKVLHRRIWTILLLATENHPRWSMASGAAEPRLGEFGNRHV